MKSGHYLHATFSDYDQGWCEFTPVDDEDESAIQKYLDSLTKEQADCLDNLEGLQILSSCPVDLSEFFQKREEAFVAARKQREASAPGPSSMLIPGRTDGNTRRVERVFSIGYGAPRKK